MEWDGARATPARAHRRGGERTEMPMPARSAAETASSGVCGRTWAGWSRTWSERPPGGKIWKLLVPELAMARRLLAQDKEGPEPAVPLAGVGSRVHPQGQRPSAV